METAPAVKREFARAATVIVRLSPAFAGVNGKRALGSMRAAENFCAKTLSPPAGVNIEIQLGPADGSCEKAFAAKAGTTKGETASEAVASSVAAIVAYFRLYARFTSMIFSYRLSCLWFV
jgi:hypothetical protein